MIREVFEETGLEVKQKELYTVYSGSRMKYKYPDGNEVVFVMFIFHAEADLTGKLAADNKTIEEISTVQRPVFEDLKKGVTTLFRT